MAEEPDNRVLILLREMRADIGRQLEDLRIEVKENNKRIESIKQAAFGESVLGRYAVAEVDERLDTIETRLRMLEAKL